MQNSLKVGRYNKSIVINKNWHLNNKMPQKPTHTERLAWHMEHVKNCDCHPLTKEFIERLKKEIQKSS